MSAKQGPQSRDQRDRSEYGGAPGPVGSRSGGAPGTVGAALTPAERAVLMRRAGAAEDAVVGLRLLRPGAPLEAIQTADQDTPPEFGVRIG